MDRKPPAEGPEFRRDSDRFEQRCARRLKEELGINPAGAEVILHMRSHILALQARIQQLETELSTRDAGRAHRLSIYRQTYFEATWHDLSDSDEIE